MVALGAPESQRTKFSKPYLVRPSHRLSMPAKPLHLLQSSALSAAACLCIAATPAKAEPWRSSVELYGPVPLRLDTTTTVVTQNNRSVTTEAVLNLGQVLDNLQWITAVRGSVEKGLQWHLLLQQPFSS